jgi:DNA-binding NtrC family response regulator
MAMFWYGFFKDIAPVAATRPVPFSHVNDSILLVDEDPSVRESLSRALRSENYCVIPAANGREAMELFRADKIALVLLDLNLSTSIGWSILRQMMAANPRRPVIIITAQSDLHEAAAQAGAVAILEKPFSLPVLLNLMERLIRALAEQFPRQLESPRTGTPSLVPDRHPTL